MKGTTRNAARCLATAVSIAVIFPANAMLPVFDIPNFIVNVINKKTLLSIDHQLKSQEDGTVVYNTINIDKSTKVSADIDFQNIEIDNTFTWIINNNNGDEIIPIPGPIQESLKKIMDWKDTNAFTGKFKSIAGYERLPEGGFPQEAAIAGSIARKAANDALVQAVGEEQDAVAREFDGLVELAEKNKTINGHGHQQQIANALAGSQVHQLMKLRSMMLVSEAVHAVEAQAKGDKDARAMAVGNHLRDGLDSAVNQSIRPRATY